ncbi:MAG: HNH endonuclease [Myxococcales bacterium]|nr:HNH endonuclease [Myxococcales bacterium]
MRTLRSALSTQVLVVNRCLQAVHITSARRAFVLLYTEVAKALDDTWIGQDFRAWASVAPKPGEASLGTSRGLIRIPRVIQLIDYDRMPRATVRLSRRNIFLRDAYTCQYCAKRSSARDLNLDHVMPRSRGGPTTWENVVCSCRVCNLEKGGRTPAEAGMKLLRRPARPRWSPVLALAFTPARPKEWEPFLSTLPGARELEQLWANSDHSADHEHECDDDE